MLQLQLVLYRYIKAERKPLHTYLNCIIFAYKFSSYVCFVTQSCNTINSIQLCFARDWYICKSHWKSVKLPRPHLRWRCDWKYSEFQVKESWEKEHTSAYSRMQMAAWWTWVFWLFYPLLFHLDIYTLCYLLLQDDYCLKSPSLAQCNEKTWRITITLATWYSWHHQTFKVLHPGVGGVLSNFLTLFFYSIYTHLPYIRTDALCKGTMFSNLSLNLFLPERAIKDTSIYS